MKEQLLQIVAAAKEKYGVKEITILLDFNKAEMMVNGKPQPSKEFADNIELIETLLRMKYGIHKIDLIKIVETHVEVYYRDAQGKKLIKKL